jgi:SAM-dependent methyltransferase
MDIVSHNREAWAKEVAAGNKWTLPVDGATIERARHGDLGILLTPTRPVPRQWLGELSGARVLCLASGGGQQGPVLAAAGAAVTVFDNCPAQLAKDELVARREGLRIELAQGDMRDLSAFADGSFDLIVHPVSNCFVDEPERVWRECHRVLTSGGALIAGFCNPLSYIFDLAAWDEGRLEVKHSIPYSDVAQLPPEELAARFEAKDTLEYGHSLESQIGGQIAAGFSIVGFYEDSSGHAVTEGGLLDPHIKTFIATRAVKGR